jgi:DNA-binding response OmpR family regulator
MLLNFRGTTVQGINGTKPFVSSSVHGVLIVDDEEPIRFALREYLVRKGLQVTCAGEVEEAEALLSTRQYSVAIVDLRLSGSYGSEGLDIISLLREKSPETRTVLLSANMTKEAEKAAEEMGVDVVLSKPIPLSGVAEIVFGLINSQSSKGL